jgi:acylphosphatase
MERRRVDYTGRVQGVGFRATCAGIARGLPVSGWVRNAPDGSVGLECQGKAEDLDRFFAEIDAAMGHFIARAQVVNIAPVEGESGFTIRR